MENRYTAIFVIIMFLATISLTQSIQKTTKTPYDSPRKTDDGTGAAGPTTEDRPTSMGNRFPYKNVSLTVCNGDFVNCTLIPEIIKTHQFLYRNKNGLPFTNDTVTVITRYSYSEFVRLNINTQAHGYLNLYKITGNTTYLDESIIRLNYIMSLGSKALGNQSIDGVIGYTFLSAYEMTGNIDYYNYGMSIANSDVCYKNPYNALNGGYACAMVLGKAYRLTNNLSYLNVSRSITKRTRPMQYPDGSFPHTNYGSKDASYTSWMMYELSLIQLDDPNNPDIDLALVKGNNFLINRVNPNGSLNYEDQYGRYYDSNNPYSRGITADLANTAYNLRTIGREDLSNSLLIFLFSKELSGNNSGSYPNQWDYVWAGVTNDSPSVLRTSLIFWYFSTIPLINQSCQNGLKIPCTITPDNCNVAYQELNKCNLNIKGYDLCMNGRFTKCFNETAIK